MIEVYVQVYNVHGRGCGSEFNWPEFFWFVSHLSRSSSRFRCRPTSTMLASSSRSALKRSRAQLATLVPSAGAAPHISSASTLSVCLLVTGFNNVLYADTLFFQSQRNASLLAKADTTHERSNNRHDLWSFTPDLQFQGSTIPRAGALGRYNVTIADLAAQGNFTEVLRLCAKMKSEGVMPDIMTYNSLISACARRTLHMEAWAIYDDMLAFGLRPDRETFHRLLQVR
jgi:pentatricopeptide repeat protein